LPASFVDYASLAHILPNVRACPIFAPVLIALGLAGGAGCYRSSDLGDGTATAQTEIPEGDYAGVLVEAQVALADRCCARAGLGAARVPDTHTGSHGLVPDRAAVAQYDARAAAACVAEISEGECPSPKAPLNAPSACDDVYARGDRQLGEHCQMHYECAQALGEQTGCEATVRREGIQRVCMAYEWAGEGESCFAAASNTVRLCEGELLCDDERGVCVRRGARGEPCLTGLNWGDTCAAGSVCDRLGSRRCVAPIPVGQPCGPGIDGECEALACVGGVCREPLSHASSIVCEE
jgi:hypothetical protein